MDRLLLHLNDDVAHDGGCCAFRQHNLHAGTSPIQNGTLTRYPFHHLRALLFALYLQFLVGLEASIQDWVQDSCELVGLVPLLPSPRVNFCCQR